VDNSAKKITKDERTLMARNIVVSAKTLYDGKGKSDGMTIVIENDRIAEVISGKRTADFEGYVTPAFIDAHSHIGMYRAGEPDSEGEGNDTSDQINPAYDPLNSVYFDDTAFTDAVDFGVLYSCIVPGSGNLLGGRASVIRNFAHNRDEALVKEYGFKMALGYNPRSTGEWKGTRPNTRMGVYAMLEKRFDSTIAKRDKADCARERKLRELADRISEGKSTVDEVNGKRMIDREYDLEFELEDRLLLELLSGTKTAKVHVHKEDDILYLIDLARRYSLKVTAEHACDVHHVEIFNKLADSAIPVVYGPLGSHPYKTELKHEHYRNASILMQSHAFFGLMTDHPVIMSQTLRETLKYFLISGMTDEAAIGVITKNNASILGIDNDLGSIEPGKLASLVIWNDHPLRLGSFPVAVIAEGAVVRDIRNKDKPAVL
jgi:imidazolonepropionase-like amidohydrolase